MRGSRALAAFVLAVGGLTVAQRAGAIPIRSVAASPDAIAHGRYWLLLTSGLFADRPTAPSLLALALFGSVGLAVVGPRVLWTTALVGHVGSTLVVYWSIALYRLGHAQAFRDVLGQHDLGLSAICAAWLGAVASVAWRRLGSARGRLGITGAVVLIGLVAWAVHPDLTPLDADHGVAFVIGVAVAGTRLRLPRPLGARATATG